MQGLSAKVFRTYNASYTMAQELAKLKPDEGTIAEKVKEYNEANRRVAILCNHKRTVPASHEGQMEKLAEKVCFLRPSPSIHCLSHRPKTRMGSWLNIVIIINMTLVAQIKGLKYQKWRIKQQMLQVEPSLKKKKGADFFKLDDELSEEWVLQHQAALVDEARQRIEKKFQKDNEKRAADGESALPDTELQQRLDEVRQLEQQYKTENKSKKIEPERRYAASVERMQAALDKLDERIRTMHVQAEMRESTKEVALGTSKIVSYLFYFPFLSPLPTPSLPLNFLFCYYAPPLFYCLLFGTGQNEKLTKLWFFFPNTRTTLTRASPSPSARSSTCRWTASSPRRFARSLIGPLSR